MKQNTILLSAIIASIITLAADFPTHSFTPKTEAELESSCFLILFYPEIDPSVVAPVISRNMVLQTMCPLALASILLRQPATHLRLRMFLLVPDFFGMDEPIR